MQRAAVTARGMNVSHETFATAEQFNRKPASPRPHCRVSNFSAGIGISCDL